MNIEVLLDQLSETTGDEWLDISMQLLELGYSWEWITRRDGTEIFLLKDKEPVHE